MLRILTAIAAGSIYVACSVVLVTSEGKAYRNALNSTIATPEPARASPSVAAESVPSPEAAPAPPVPIKPAEHSDPKPAPEAPPPPTALAVNKSIPPRPAAATVPTAVTPSPSVPNRAVPEAGRYWAMIEPRSDGTYCI